MKITGIRATNIIGLRSIERGFAHPVALICGRNMAGKSSLAATIRMTLTGMSERVHLKKDLPQLVTEGAKEGEAVVNVEHEGERAALHLALPDGESTPWPMRPAFLDFCLDPWRFATLTVDQRRETLFAVMGLRADSQAAMKRLIDKGCDAKYVEIIGEDLKAGFPVAHTEATTRAREAKGAWRGVTGETWGKDKAAAWQPTRPTFGDSEREILAKVQRDLATAIEAERTAGNESARVQALAEAVPLAGGDAAKAKRVEVLAEQLTEKTRERDDWQTKVKALEETIEAPAPLACPHCAGLVLQDGFSLRKYEGAAHERSEAKTKLPAARESLKLMNTVVTNLVRDLDEAREHRAKLAAANGVKAPTPHEITKAADAYKAAVAETCRVRQEETDMLDTQRLAQAADTAKAKADEHHREVLGWLAIADAVAPSGIPAEILSQALKPFNDKLREAATMTGWRQATITSDMTITAEGRPYWLLSRSEQWRMNAMIAYAIASRGPRFLLLDELDLLDLNGRGEAIAWVTTLVDLKRLDGAIFCATLKNVPDVPGVHAIWLEAGHGIELEKAA